MSHQQHYEFLSKLGNEKLQELEDYLVRNKIERTDSIFEFSKRIHGGIEFLIGTTRVFIYFKCSSVSKKCNFYTYEIQLNPSSYGSTKMNRLEEMDIQFDYDLIEFPNSPEIRVGNHLGWQYAYLNGVSRVIKEI